jgi:hypothetical protein
MMSTELIRAFERVRQMERDNPLLAFAYLAEGIGDGRIRCDACANAQLAEIRDMARRAVRRASGGQFHNELYGPLTCSRKTFSMPACSASRRWRRRL